MGPRELRKGLLCPATHLRCDSPSPVSDPGGLNTNQKVKGFKCAHTMYNLGTRQTAMLREYPMRGEHIKTPPGQRQEGQFLTGAVNKLASCPLHTDGAGSPLSWDSPHTMSSSLGH